MHSHDVSIYVLVDALGWELLRERSFLDEVLPRRRRVETILGYSSGAIPTLLTGQMPRGHGHWNLFYRSPETSPFRWTRPLTALPETVRENRVTRRVIKEISKRVSGYDGYFAVYNLPVDRMRYYDICETSDIYQPGGLAPARSIFDLMADERVRYRCYNYHQYSDEQTLSLVPDQISNPEVDVFFLYLSGLDSYLHFNVKDAEGVSAKMRFYEDGLRRVHDAAVAAGRRPAMCVFSDHGMTPIRETRDLIAEVEKLPLEAPDDYLPSYDSTMARFWFSSGEAETRLRELLEGLPYGRVLPPEELARLGLDFDDNRYGDLVFLMEPSVLICPSDMGSITFDGMHGFHPQEDPHAHAVFLSNWEPSSPVQHTTEVFPALVENLMDRGLLSEAPELIHA